MEHICAVVWGSDSGARRFAMPQLGSVSALGMSWSHPPADGFITAPRQSVDNVGAVRIIKMFNSTVRRSGPTSKDVPYA